MTMTIRVVLVELYQSRNKNTYKTRTDSTKLGKDLTMA